MKTIKNISLTLLMITLTGTLSAAGNIRTFQSQLNNGKTISIVSKLESLLEESIPGFENFVSQFRTRNHLVKLEMLCSEEIMIVEELAEISVYNVFHHTPAIAYMPTLNSKEEPVIEEDAYSMEIINTYQASIHHHAEEVNIQRFIKSEKELDEEICIFAHNNLTAK